MTPQPPQYLSIRVLTPVGTLEHAVHDVILPVCAKVRPHIKQVAIPNSQSASRRLIHPKYVMFVLSTAVMCQSFVLDSLNVFWLVDIMPDLLLE